MCKSLDEKIHTMKKRKAAAVIILALGVAMMLGGYFLTTLWLTTSYVTSGAEYHYGAWRIIPASRAGDIFTDPVYEGHARTYEALQAQETVNVTFASAANGTLGLKITCYPQGKTLLLLEAPQYEATLNGSGGPGISYGGGNTTVYTDFVLPAGTSNLNLWIVNNSTQPVNSTYAYWSLSYPVFTQVYASNGWAVLFVGAILAVSGAAIQVGGKEVGQETGHPTRTEAEQGL